VLYGEDDLGKEGTWVLKHKYKVIVAFMFLELFYFILYQIFNGPLISWLLLAVNTAAIGVLTIIFHIYIWKE